MCDRGKRKPGSDDERRAQLLALAREGNEDAVGDLWREYGIEYRGGAE